MKRYFIFAYDQYYPAGGMVDFYNDSDIEAEAMQEAYVAELTHRHVQVYDTALDKYVKHPREWESWSRIASADRLGVRTQVWDTEE